MPITRTCCGAVRSPIRPVTFRVSALPEMGCRTGFDPVPPASQARMLSHHTHDTIRPASRCSSMALKMLPCATLNVGTGQFNKEHTPFLRSFYGPCPHVLLVSRRLPLSRHLHGGLRQIIGLALVALRRTKCKNEKTLLLFGSRVFQKSNLSVILLPSFLVRVCYGQQNTTKRLYSTLEWGQNTAPYPW